MNAPTCPSCHKSAIACACTRDRLSRWVGGHESAAARELCRRQAEAWLRAAGRWREYPLRCGECGKRLDYGEIVAGGKRCRACVYGGVAEMKGTNE